MEIAVIAGEVSGDIHAARLIREVRGIKPDVKIWGICGPKMQEEGAEAVCDITELAVVGFFEVIKNYGKIRNVFYRILDEIKKRNPDAVILVDYPGFNLRLAKKIKPLGIPVFYYISPQVWAWGRGRIMEIREFVDKMIVIFPFEKELYEKENVPVEFTGHPIVDVITDRVSKRDEFRKELKLGAEEKLIGILPGSRTGEVKRHLPVFLDAVKKIKNAKFVAGAASEGISELIKDILKKKDLSRTFHASSPQQATGSLEKVRDKSIPVLLGRSYDIMEASDLILTSSGTATLETACFGTPMVVIYKLSWLTYLFLRKMVHVPYIAMANLIAGEKVVPEFIQHEANAGNISAEIIRILENPDVIKNKLKSVREKLGERGAARRAANIICEAISD